MSASNFSRESRVDKAINSVKDETGTTLGNKHAKDVSPIGSGGSPITSTTILTKETTDVNVRASIYKTLNEIATPNAAIQAGDFLNEIEMTDVFDQNGGHGQLLALTVLVRAVLAPSIEFSFFSQNPDVDSAINAAQDINTADMPYFIQKVDMWTGGVAAVSSGSSSGTPGYVFYLAPLGGLVWNTASSKSLWVVARMLSTITFTGTAQLAIIPHIVRL